MHGLLLTRMRSSHGLLLTCMRSSHGLLLTCMRILCKCVFLFVCVFSSLLVSLLVCTQQCAHSLVKLTECILLLLLLLLLLPGLGCK